MRYRLLQVPVWKMEVKMLQGQECNSGPPALHVFFHVGEEKRSVDSCFMFRSQRAFGLSDTAFFLLSHVSFFSQRYHGLLL